MDSSGMRRRHALKLLALVGAAVADSRGAHAQDSGAGGSAGGKVILENDKVRVIEHLGRARLGVCGTGLHSHPPHLTVFLTDVRARVTLPGKDPRIAENKAGDVFWDPGGPHVVENVGGRGSKVYLVELKGASS